MNFDDLFSRADDELLQGLIGKEGLRLLIQMDIKVSTPSNLRQTAIVLYSREGLLRSSEVRPQLIDLLNIDEATSLASLLNLKIDGDVYPCLKSYRFPRNSEREKLLFDYFELDVPTDISDSNIQPDENVTGKYSLFRHQRIAAQQTYINLSKDPMRSLLHMPTGAGKTRTAMHIIARHLLENEHTAVIWLAYSEELCNQASEEFLEAWSYLGNREVTLHRCWGKYDLDPGTISDGLIIAGLSKIYSKAKTNISFISKLSSACTLVIIDEAHQAIAETYKLVLESLLAIGRDTKLLGLTATPGRTWNDISADEELAEFFGKKKVCLEIPGYSNPIDYLVEEEYLAKVHFESLFNTSGLRLSERDVKYIEDKLDIPKRVLEQLANDTKRNMQIILKTEELLKRHRRIIIFALSVQHSNMLATVLNGRGINAFSVTAGTPPESRAAIISDFKSDDDKAKVICNYGVLTTGFDAPKTSAAVIARPTASLVLYSQMVGRAIRGVKAGGNRDAEIVTVVDQELPGFGAVTEAFENWEDVWRK